MFEVNINNTRSRLLDNIRVFVNFQKVEHIC